MHIRTIACLVSATALAGTVNAQIIPFDFQGNAGSGLLPGNENGTGAETSSSTAIGGETGMGLTYDTVTNVLSFSFEFENLTGGLANVSSGIHFHNTGDVADPFGANGGIAFNLNSGTDPNVTLATPLIAFGSSSGVVSGTAQLTEALEEDLRAGRFYLNIHSGAFGGGELRGNLVEVPAPGAGALLALGGLTLRRRRA
ncbi:MAG: hypothetical protein Tsb0013_08700 [Phycisphaerales bacterium]